MPTTLRHSAVALPGCLEQENAEVFVRDVAPRLRGAARVHFITHSLGGIIVEIGRRYGLRVQVFTLP